MPNINLVGPEPNGDFLIEQDRRIVGSFSPEDGLLSLDFGESVKEIKLEVERRLGTTVEDINIDNT